MTATPSNILSLNKRYDINMSWFEVEHPQPDRTSEICKVHFKCSFLSSPSQLYSKDITNCVSAKVAELRKKFKTILVYLDDSLALNNICNRIIASSRNLKILPSKRFERSQDGNYYFREGEIIGLTSAGQRGINLLYEPFPS